MFVNNAGAFSNYLLDEMPPEEFQRVINTNITGSFLCAQAAARVMRADGGWRRHHQHGVGGLVPAVLTRP